MSAACWVLGLDRGGDGGGGTGALAHALTGVDGRVCCRFPFCSMGTPRISLSGSSKGSSASMLSMSVVLGVSPRLVSNSLLLSLALAFCGGGVLVGVAEVEEEA